MRSQPEQLLFALQCAVPMWLMKLNSMPGNLYDGTISWWIYGSATYLGGQGDVLLYGDKKKAGGAGEAFNVLAQALTALSTFPGGVKFLGHVWCAKHSPTGTTSASQVCQQCLEAAPA